MKFDSSSWKVCAVEFAQAAESLSARATANLEVLGDVVAVGADNPRPTLVDTAIATIVPESVQYVTEVVDAIIKELVAESERLYNTALRYRDVELDNTLAANKLAEALADTPYNP